VVARPKHPLAMAAANPIPFKEVDGELVPEGNSDYCIAMFSHQSPENKQIKLGGKKVSEKSVCVCVCVCVCVSFNTLLLYFMIVYIIHLNKSTLFFLLCVCTFYIFLNSFYLPSLFQHLAAIFYDCLHILHVSKI
jgi:hypothetical protein